jgi:hypothetical protein
VPPPSRIGLMSGHSRRGTMGPERHAVNRATPCIGDPA